MSTMAERVLAVLLVGFLLVGGLWLYERLDDYFTRPDRIAFEVAEGVPAAQAALAAAEQALAGRERRAEEGSQVLADATREYEYRREEYRTALEAGDNDPSLKAALDGARAAYEAAVARVAGAKVLVGQSRADVGAARTDLEPRLRRVETSYERATLSYYAKSAGLRLAYLLAAFAVALLVWKTLQRRESRYEAMGLAFLVFASIQMVVMAGDYAWHHLSDFAPLVISVAGVAGTVAALVALKRYLLAPARIGRYRLRHGGCPHCGHPLEQASAHCPACGKLVREACSHCGGRHPVFSDFCPETGRPLLAHAGRLGSGSTTSDE